MPVSLLLVYLVTWLLCVPVATAQTVHKHVFSRTASDETPSQDNLPKKRTVYQLNPAASPARGLLILLPGRHEPTSDVFRATTLAQQATQRGFVVVVPALNDRKYLDTASTLFLDDVVGMLVRQYPGLTRHIVLGGFSAGGQLAFAYAEKLVLDSTRHPWRVRAVLGVDPPLDLTEHWQRAEYHLAKNDCPDSRATDQNTLRELTYAMGGSPTQFRSAYLNRTAFLRSDSAGGNAKWLTRLPVRLYSEPDLAFWQQTCPALELADLNAAGAAALITRLQKQGNTRAQYLQTTGKGFVGKRRMPHSWSIVDAPECAEWMQHCLD